MHRQDLVSPCNFNGEQNSGVVCVMQLKTSNRFATLQSVTIEDILLLLRIQHIFGNDPPKTFLVVGGSRELVRVFIAIKTALGTANFPYVLAGCRGGVGCIWACRLPLSVSSCASDVFAPPLAQQLMNGFDLSMLNTRALEVGLTCTSQWRVYCNSLPATRLNDEGSKSELRAVVVQEHKLWLNSLNLLPDSLLEQLPQQVLAAAGSGESLSCYSSMSAPTEPEESSISRNVVRQGENCLRFEAFSSNLACTERDRCASMTPWLELEGASPCCQEMSSSDSKRCATHRPKQDDGDP
eukprot:568065-Amphidinium_carterae.3